MKKSELITCPNCEGKGTWSCVATVLDETGWHKAPPVEMPCHTCNETGKVDPVEMEKKRKANEEFWCSCEDSSGVQFFDDGESSVCSKHHYVCNDCGKVAQVG